ncbi:MAG: hypothetical protein VZS44_03050 [Bacilli bacterium]|nr:hypothetical protein [Bacilli bacterium]
MKNIFKILIVIYAIVAIFTTVSLFTYNDYNISEIGSKRIIKLNKKIDKYNKGNMLIISKKDEYKAGDKVFYCKLEESKCNINYGKITTTMGGNPEINKEEISKKLIMGTDENIKVIPLLGSIMGILESRWIYLIFIVLPILVAFIYEVYSITKEIKKPQKKH